MLPKEVDQIVSNTRVSRRMAEKIWNSNSVNMIPGTLLYDNEAIKLSIQRDRKKLIWNTVQSFGGYRSNKEIILKLSEYGQNLFSVEKVMKGKHHIDSGIVKKIGIHDKMLRHGNIFYTYAACHHCYNKISEIPGNYIITSHCYRNEKEYNEYRRRDFDMFEIVSFDADKKLFTLQWELLCFIIAILEKSCIMDYQIVVANDSFMTDETEKLLYQMLCKSKIEVLVQSMKYKKNIAVASLNFHKKNFINMFNLSEDISYNSMCFGIGIDRLKNILLEYNN